MNYQEAKKIRGRGYISHLTDKLAEGQGFGSAIKSTISEKSKARAVGRKEKFDPLNIAKFMTGGSKFAPALLGSMTGRTKQDIQYFAGNPKAKNVDDTATKIGSLESDNKVLDVLLKIYDLMKSVNENDIKRRDQENSMKEEIQFEKERRHKELIEAITGKKNQTAAPQTATKEESGGGMLAGIMAMVTGLIGDAIKGVMSVVEGVSGLVRGILSAFSLGPLGPLRLLAGLGAFLISPLGLGLMALAAGAITAYAFWKILKSDPSEEAKAEAAGIAQAEKVGGLPGVKNEMDRQKKLPEYDRTMAEIKNYQFSYNESAPLNNVQLKGFAERGPGALEAVEDYKMERDRVQKTITEKNKTAIQVPAQFMANKPTSETATPSTSETASLETNKQNAGPELMNQISGATSKLNTVTKENLDLSLPSKPDAVVEAQVTNNTNINKTTETRPKGSIPAVRNLETSFHEMIMYSTRVV